MLFLQPLVARKAQTNWCADCLLSSGRECVCDGSGGIRPTVPFGGKCSATERYVISFSQNKRDKSARAKDSIRKRLDYFCQTFSCTTPSRADAGGDKGTRTLGLCVANASLYQLSHIPIWTELVKCSVFFTFLTKFAE